MMRIVASLTLVLALLLSGTAMGDDKQTTDSAVKATEKQAVETIDPTKLDGMQLYQTYCKSCHAADSEYGEYTPMSLIMDQWDEFYDGVFAETHKEVSDEVTGGVLLPKFLTKDMLNKLRKFCVDHAADSEEPMTCG